MKKRTRRFLVEVTYDKAKFKLERRDLEQAIGGISSAITVITVLDAAKPDPAPAPAGIDLVRLRDDLAKLNGKPPYNDPANFCWNDNHFARSLVTKYGADLSVLERWAEGGGR